MEQERIKQTFGKVVYKEPDDPPRAVKGLITEEEDFFKVEHAHGVVIISKAYVVAVKISTAGEVKE